MNSAGEVPELTWRRVDHPLRQIEPKAKPGIEGDSSGDTSKSVQPPFETSADRLRELMRGLDCESYIDGPSAKCRIIPKPETRIPWNGPKIDDATLKGWFEEMLIAAAKQTEPLSEDRIRRITDGRISGEAGRDLSQIINDILDIYTDSKQRAMEARYDASHPVAKAYRFLTDYSYNEYAANELAFLDAKGTSDWRVHFNPKTIRYYGYKSFSVAIPVSNAAYLEEMEDSSPAFSFLRKLRKAQDSGEDIFPTLLMALHHPYPETLITLEQAFSKSPALPPDCHLDISKLSETQRYDLADVVLMRGMNMHDLRSAGGEPYATMFLLASLGDEGKSVLESERCRRAFQDSTRSIEGGDVRWAGDVARRAKFVYRTLTGNALFTPEETFEENAGVAGTALEEAWTETLDWLNDSAHWVHGTTRRSMDSAKRFFNL